MRWKEKSREKREEKREEWETGDWSEVRGAETLTNIKYQIVKY